MATVVSTAASINKAWIGGITAPIADWVVELFGNYLLNHNIIMPEGAHTALVSLIVGLVIWTVPNIPKPDPTDSVESGT